jgi:hypothetical protein
MFTISGVALGNTCTVATTLVPDEVNASLHCAVITDSGRPPEVIVDRLTQLLRREQDARLESLANDAGKDIEEQIRQIEKEQEAFFAGAIMRDPVVVASFQQRIRNLDRRRRPTLIIEYPAPGSLERAAARSAGSLMVVYDESFLAAQKKPRGDIEILVRSWRGKSPQTCLLQETALTSPVRPLVGSLFLLSQSALAQLACSSDPVRQQLFEQLLIVPSPGSKTVVPDRYNEIFAHCLEVSRHPPKFRLASSADARLGDFIAENERPESVPSRHSSQAPWLALKVALILHIWLRDPRPEIADETMALAITKTKELILQSATMANQCVGPHLIGEDEKRQSQLLAELRAHGPLSNRDLYRTNGMKAEKLQQLIQPLIKEGLVRRRDDDRLELTGLP